MPIRDRPAPYAPRNEVVLDPFAGCGTSLVEAVRLGLPAYGGDLNPAAVALARVYRLVDLDAAERAALLDGLRERLFEAIMDAIREDRIKGFDARRPEPSLWPGRYTVRTSIFR